MLEQLDSWDRGEIALTSLVSNLQGLFDASDVRHDGLRNEFYGRWAELDMVTELRTEPWAPPGVETDERLGSALASIRIYVEHVLAQPGRERD